MAGLLRLTGAARSLSLSLSRRASAVAPAPAPTRWGLAAPASASVEPEAYCFTSREEERHRARALAPASESRSGGAPWVVAACRLGPQRYAHSAGLAAVLGAPDTGMGTLVRQEASLAWELSTKVLHLTVHMNHERPFSTATASKVPIGARKVGMKVVMMSPGFVYEPYSPRERIPFWRRWFTLSGWRRTKEDIILEMKNAYAVSRLRKKTGYTKKQFYDQALKIYKEVNTLMAHGDTSSLRKILTERMHSTIKNELKRRQSMWSSVHWELVEPAVSIRTLRARMIGLDKNDLDKAFIQLTLEFVTKQKFEAYNSKGEVVSGDKSKEVLVKDIWVFERSLFHPGAYWRVCGRITL